MRSSLRVAVLAVFPYLVSAGCGDDGPTEPRPTTGTIALRVLASGEDRSGVLVVIDNRLNLSVPLDTTKYARNLTPGDHSVFVQTHQNNCTLSGANPQTATVVAGDTAEVVISMSCVARIGKLRIVTATTGAEIDDDGYTVRIDAGAPRAVGVSEELVLDLREGTHAVELSGVARNCVVSGPISHTIEVDFGEQSDVTFNVECHQSGALNFSVNTTGTDPDVDGYRIHVTGGGFDTTVTLAADGSATLPKLLPTSYTATVLGVALNCDLTASHRIDVTVTSGATTSVPLSVVCGAGTRIAYVSYEHGQGEIYTIWSTGGGKTRLTSTDAGEDAPAWSPDANRIAFVSDRDGSADIYVMNADGSNVLKLTHDDAHDWSPRWSPDGASIIFVSDRDGDNEIYRMTSDGQLVTKLTDNSHQDADPAWSPPGDRIAFTSNRGGDLEIFVMNADGSAQQPLTNDQHEVWGGLDWSPDGTMIAYGRGPCDYYYGCFRDLYVVNADGSGNRRLASGDDDDYAPSWSPDGRRLAYTSVRCSDYYCYDFSSRILVIRVDGSDITELIGSHAASPAWRR